MNPIRLNKLGLLLILASVTSLGLLSLYISSSSDKNCSQKKERTIKDEHHHEKITKSKPVGEYAKTYELKGMLFTNKTVLGSMDNEVKSTITISVVRSLSTEVKWHVTDMFNDQHKECQFFATLPAMTLRNGKIHIVQRIWLAQYENMKNLYRNNNFDFSKMANEWYNSWQENYLYYMVLDTDYKLLQPGRLLGIPTTTNMKFYYKSDGPMDPRLIQVGDDYLLVFHSWLVDIHSNNQASGRVHIWDMQRHVKKQLLLSIKLQRTDINWIPIDVNGELYLTYSIDPLRVIKCDGRSGNCEFVYEQKGTKKNPFVYTSDHLRGGTQWLCYKHPYYISVAHNVANTYKPALDFAMYYSNIVVIRVDPWRVVYTSRNLEMNADWLRSEPIKRNFTIVEPFFYPAGLILWDNDTIDVSGHLNDASGHILRITGISALMSQIINKDMENKNHAGPQVRVVQQYVLESTKLLHKDKWSFVGDILENTVEDPETGNMISTKP